MREKDSYVKIQVPCPNDNTNQTQGTRQTHSGAGPVPAVTLERLSASGDQLRIDDLLHHSFDRGLIQGMLKNKDIQVVKEQLSTDRSAKKPGRKAGGRQGKSRQNYV